MASYSDIEKSKYTVRDGYWTLSCIPGDVLHGYSIYRKGKIGAIVLYNYGKPVHIINIRGHFKQSPTIDSMAIIFFR